MTMTWAVSPLNNDVFINRDGLMQMVYGAEEVRQRIGIALRHYWKEYFLNVPAGVPWYELILGSKDLSMTEALLRKTILEVPNVLSILNFQINMTGRAVTVDSQVEVSGINGPQVIDVLEAIIT